MIGDAQISGVDELYVFLAFLQPLREGTHGICGAAPESGDAGLRMSLLFGLIVLRGAFLRAGWRLDAGLSAVAVGASQVYGAGGMHRWRICLSVACDAAGAFRVGFLLGLAEEGVGLGEEDRAQSDKGRDYR